MKRYSSTYSFSLIEVLVFVTILGLFFIAASAVAVATLRNMKTNEHKIIATHLGEQLVEWLRSEKESNWNLFVTNASCPTNKCFSSLDWTGSCNMSCNKIDTTYTRTADFDAIPVGSPTQVNVTVKVGWSELGNTYEVPIQTNFSLFGQ